MDPSAGTSPNESRPENVPRSPPDEPTTPPRPTSDYACTDSGEHPSHANDPKAPVNADQSRSNSPASPSPPQNLPSDTKHTPVTHFCKENSPAHAPQPTPVTHTTRLRSASLPAQCKFQARRAVHHCPAVQL